LRRTLPGSALSFSPPPLFTPNSAWLGSFLLTPPLFTPNYAWLGSFLLTPPLFTPNYALLRLLPSLPFYFYAELSKTLLPPKKRPNTTPSRKSVNV
ncbi:hypothetical protein, partial [Alkalihalobacillus alcalophilus]|uniref:hypothetical protein n=1 Tax=Alkalihalobacillus alcalophilus TaxID=1445 RepID=UPI001F20DF1D